jgi:hypothetical protein
VDAAIETVAVGSRQSRWSDGQEPSGPWGELAGILRRLLVALTDQPQAAVELRLGDNAAVLRHLGGDELELDLSTATVRTVRWTDGFPVAGGEGQVNGPRSATASPGWTWEIPLGEGRDPNGMVTVEVDKLLLFDGQFWTACSLQSPMPPVEQAS